MSKPISEPATHADSLIFIDGGERIVDVARSSEAVADIDGVTRDGFTEVEWTYLTNIADIEGVARDGYTEVEWTYLTSVADIDGITSDTFFDIILNRADGGGRTVGSGQVTEILERVDGTPPDSFFDIILDF